MNKKQIATALAFFLLAGMGVWKAQTVTTKYFISFKDKIGTPFSVNNSAAFLSGKSVTRRTYYNIATDITDLPVTPSYVAQVAAIPNVRIIFPIKWLNGVLVRIDTLQSAALASINSLSCVASSTPTNRYKLNPLEHLSDPIIPQQQSQRSAGTQNYAMGGSTIQNQQLGVDCLHNLNFMGAGMTIAVLDVGFNNVDVNTVFTELRNRNGILGTHNFVDGTNVYDAGAHGAEVLSCMTGRQPGLIWGSAPDADYWLLKTEDDNSETPTEEYNWVRGAEFADSVGADILTTSLGYTQFDRSTESHTYATLNGRTAPMSIAATMAARKGLFVVNSAGNDGSDSWHYISVPADADSICTVGAVDDSGNIASFSSVGPTFDQRIKPDLVAVGVGAWVAGTDGVCFPGNGTSFATPILAGAVACFWQANKWYNNMEILRRLKASASNAANPNNSIGWGIPNVCAAYPLGITKITNTNSDFLVAPNPLHNSVTVTLHQSGAKVLSLEVQDLLGKVILSFRDPDLEGNGLTLNTAALPDGVYFIHVKTTEGMSSKKIIKQ